MTLKMTGSFRVPSGSFKAGDLIVNTLPGWDTATVTEQGFTSSDNVSNDRFGRWASISADGTKALVGAGQDNTTEGSVYYFERTGNTWSQVQKITPPASIPGLDISYFGNFMDMSADGLHAVIGAHNSTRDGIVSAGAALYYTRSGSTWTYQGTILPSDSPTAGDYFGVRISLSNDGASLMVGSHLEDTPVTDAGSVYFYTRSGTTWTQQQKISSSDAQVDDRFSFGCELSGDGNTAVIGAYLEDTNATDAGSAYVFTRSGNTFTQQQIIRHPDPGLGDRFGRDIALSDDGQYMLVSAIERDANGTDTGGMYYYTRSGSTYTQQGSMLAPTSPVVNENFGGDMQLNSDGTVAFVGAQGYSSGGTLKGSVYIFERTNNTWAQTKKIVPTGSVINNRFGNNISVSSDGKTVMAGAFFDEKVYALMI